MPLFTNSTPFDNDVERATSELNARDDPLLFKEVCDKVKLTSTGPRDCLRSIVKRMNDKVPQVALQALGLLDACVQNCGYAFRLEVATRDFVSECRTFITSGKPHSKVVQRLKQLIKKWAENEFKSDSSLSIIPTMYNSLKSEGHIFPTSEEMSKDCNSAELSKKEEDDLARAIAMSLKDTGRGSSLKSSQPLYPSMMGSGGSAPNTSFQKELRKVRTLYDFEAAEDNELTFKAGEILSILDDSDPNWWKGCSYRGEGLFPANFVSADLTAEPEPDYVKTKKSVHFHDEVDVKVLEPVVPEILEIDESKIEATLNLIQNADPVGESNSDPPELLGLEEQCKAMGPLIDQELERIDRQHIALMEDNTKLMDALKMYNSLMAELPNYGYVSHVAPGQMLQQQNQFPTAVQPTNSSVISNHNYISATSNVGSSIPYPVYGQQVNLNQPMPSSYPPTQPYGPYSTGSNYPQDPSTIPFSNQSYNSVPTGNQSQQPYLQMPMSAPNLL